MLELHNPALDLLNAYLDTDTTFKLHIM